MQVLTVFEVPTRREVTVAAPPLPLLYGGGGVPGTPIWNSDSRCFRIRRVERGYTAEVPATLCQAACLSVCLSVASYMINHCRPCESVLLLVLWRMRQRAAAKDWDWPYDAECLAVS